ncbi:MAG: class I SAM-dependent methyltransferase [Tabrizicola sp.]|nr:class I SAM-dependent methyltransferase [Tabrizicola sp.]
MLHFAPERRLSRLLRGLAGEYVTADLMRPAVDLKLNIEALDLPDASFDVVIAHQILEHVDHHKALAECFRCLRPGGLVIATFPIVEGWSTTYENPSITSKRDRFLHFGQFDHIKFFGRDIRVHIGAAGFEIEEFVSVEPDVVRYGLIRGETLFILKKPRSQQTTKIGSQPATAAKKD